MAKTDNIQGIKNPYKSLKIDSKSEIPVSKVREISKQVGFDFKTRKRADTKIQNFFADNKELGKLLEKEKLSSKEISDVIKHLDQDFQTFNKNYGIAKKNQEKAEKLLKGSAIEKFSDMKKIVKNEKSLTGYEVRNNTKKFIIRPSVKALKFAVSHPKTTIASGLFIYAIATTSMLDSIDIKKINSDAAQVEQVETTKTERPLELMKDLSMSDNVYQERVNELSSVVLNRDYYYTFGTDDFNEFGKVYKDHMKTLKSLQGDDNELRVSRDEGEAFLALQYIATNSYYKDREEKLKNLEGTEKRRLELEIALYGAQLQSIEKALGDMKSGVEKTKIRKITSGKNKSYSYVTDVHGDFIIQGLEKRNFK